jgi:hypothetical protein
MRHLIHALLAAWLAALSGALSSDAFVTPAAVVDAAAAAAVAVEAGDDSV